MKYGIKGILNLFCDFGEGSKFVFFNFANVGRTVVGQLVVVRGTRLLPCLYVMVVFLLPQSTCKDWIVSRLLHVRSVAGSLVSLEFKLGF